MPKNYTEEELKNGHWATSNGVHIFIKDGEDISDAFARTTDRVKEESIKGTPLMQATALIRPKTISIDGYSKKATIKGALSDLAKAVEKYDKSEADGIRSMIKFGEIEQFRSKDSPYVLEWEEVNGTSEDKPRPANFYVHTNFYKS